MCKQLYSDPVKVVMFYKFTLHPVALTVTALNTTTVTVVEGEGVDISCLASANPLPTSPIAWTFNSSPTSFSQTDTIENKTAYIPRDGTFSFSEGNITSTLHITAAVYPTNDGVYMCSSTSDTTLSGSITVKVQGRISHEVYYSPIIILHTLTVPPEVTVTATSSRIALGQSTDLICSITRSVPSNYTIKWTLTNTDDVTTTLSDIEDTLVVTDIAEDMFGIYTCTATNSAHLSGSANITIKQGGRKFSPLVSYLVIYTQYIHSSNNALSTSFVGYI